jgi:hypothetical protein
LSYGAPDLEKKLILGNLPNAFPKILKRKYLVEYPINIVGKITPK